MAVLGLYGARAHVHIAERIGALALAGDAAGVERWLEIAGVIEAMMKASKH